MRTKILDLAQEIDKELEEREKREQELEVRLVEQNSRIYQLEDYTEYLEGQINKEKEKRRKAAQKFHEFASWLETED